MKNLDFLKTTLIVNKGIYDNQTTFENTIESFSKAIKNNYQISFSLNITKDNKIIVYDNNDLTKLMNLKDKINSITYEELNYLCSYHVPTLKEALDLIKGKVPIIINIKNKTKKNLLLKELIEELDNYNGEFALISKNVKVINWFNKNKPNYIIGEILTKRRSLSLVNFIINCLIVTDFKSININYYDIYKIKQIKEDFLVLGYLINDQEKYLVYKDVFDNLMIDRLYELNMIEEIL